MALWATDAGESSLKASAAEKLLNGSHHYGPKGPGLALKTLLVGVDVCVEMLLEELIEGRTFRMPGPIRKRRITKQKGGLRREGIVGPSSRFFRQTGCLRAPGHDSRQTSCGHGAATGLTAARRS